MTGAPSAGAGAAHATESAAVLPLTRRGAHALPVAASVRSRRGPMVRRMLIAADVIGLAAAFVALQALVGSANDADNDLALEAELALFVGGLVVWLVVARVAGLYDRDEERPTHTTVDDLVGVVVLTTLLVWAIVALGALTNLVSPDIEKWVLFWLFATALVVVGRSCARWGARRRDAYPQRVLVVGAGESAQLVARKLLQHDEYAMDVVGFAGTAAPLRADLRHVPVLGGVDELADLVHRHNVERVVLADDAMKPAEFEQHIRTLQWMGVRVDVLPRFFAALGPSVQLFSVEGVQLVGVPPVRMGREALAVKRMLDLVAGSVLFVLVAPLLAVLALLVKRDSPGPALFRQTRLGMNQAPFTVLKFRTMRVGTSHAEHRAFIRRTMDRRALPEADGLYKLDRGDTVTKVGRFLRRTSLDELPQLLNVLRGEMSLVGPRPCIAYEIELFEPHHFERFTVPAGITGLWQVRARAHSTFAEALDLDVAYARSRTLALDLRLLFETPLHMLRRRSTK